MTINIADLEYNLRQWFLDPFKVWGIYEGKLSCFEIFAGSLKEALTLAVQYGIKLPKVIV